MSCSPLLRFVLRAALRALLAGAPVAFAQTILLDNFNAGTATGSVVPGSSWVGNLTQNAGTLTIGGSARDDNGWRATGQTINATGMNFLTVTGQRDPGHAALSFSIQFEDRNLNTQVFLINATAFASGTLSTVQLALGAWSAGFDPTRITAWSIGGGGLGVTAFRMTLDQIALSATANPGVPVAPAIAGDFGASTRAPGGSISFTVTATGTAPFTYQWYKNATTALPATASAATATLTLASLTALDAGTYTCTVTNAAGSVVSGAFVLTVSAPAATVTLGSLATTYTGAARTVTAATVPVGLALAITYNGSPTAPVNAGTYAVVATVNDPNFTGRAEGSLVVAKAIQSIAFAPLPATLRVGVPFTVTATATSGGPVLLVVLRGNATLNGATVTANDAATVTLRATQAGDGNYLAVSTDFAFTTSKQNQSIEFAALANPAPGTTSLPLAATATSGLPVVFSIVSGPATVSGATVTLSGGGLVIVRATQPGNDAFNAAADLDRAFTAIAPLAPVPPTILAAPASRSGGLGTTLTLTVAAGGDSPLTYQWFKDDTVLAGATTATLTLAALQPAQAGSYTVTVRNAAGSVTSRAAVVTVLTRSFAGSYFGTLGRDGGFALYLRDERTGVFTGYAGSPALAYVSTAVTLDDAGNVRFSAAGETFEATIGGTGALTGASRGQPPLTLTGTRSAAAGAPRATAGYYEAGAAGGSARAYAIVGAAGEIFLLTQGTTGVDGGNGTVDTSGAVRVTTAARQTATGTVTGDTASLALTLAPASGPGVTYAGLRDDAPGQAQQRLVNLSTRARAGAGDQVAIAGFVITGEAAKPVLIRAVGPTLAAFGVTGVVPAPKLELFRGSTLVGTNTGWSSGGSTVAIAAAAERVGAFALGQNTADSALLITLAPGNYTAVISAADGRTGVGLVEAYDLSDAVAGQRISNLSVRAFAGTDADILIVGVVVQGTVPKRMLVRAVGPGLTPFGVSGVLARPQLAIFSGTTELVRNAGWSASADAATLTEAAAQTGAFPLAAASADSALVLHLAPGAYTAQVSGVGATAGVALVEVYELR